MIHRKYWYILVFSLAMVIYSTGAAGDENSVRWTAKSIEIKGNHTFDDNRLKAVMVTRASGWFISGKFHPAVFREDLSDLEEFYHQNGYLEAQISDTTITRNREEHTLDISLEIDEGPVTLVEGIALFGNRTFSDSTLLSFLELSRGEPFRLPSLQEGMISIASFYADRGYLDASVTPETKRNREARRVLIDLMITEGEQMTISDIRIEGLVKTKPWVVERELNFRKGEVISHSKLMTSQKQLYLTGLFRSVIISPEKRSGAGPGKRTVVIRVEEKLNSMFTFSAGYGSVEKVMGETELSFNNLLGTGRRIGIRLQANFIERKVEGSFSQPRLLGSRFTTDVNLFLNYQNQPGFDVTGYGGLLTLGRQLQEHSRLMIRYRHENQRLNNVETADPPEELDPRIRSMTLDFSMDTRDNLFNSTRGWFLGASYELAGAFLQGTDAFNRATADVRWFHPLRFNTILATSLKAGWVDILGSSGSIPINELFYTGGPNSIRGFEYRRAGPLDRKGQPLGGKFMLVWNGEIRQSVWRWIGVAAFLDAGSVWRSTEDVGWEGIRYALGPGIRVNSPIGIARLDAGFNPDPREGEDRVRYNFSMGHAF